MLTIDDFEMATAEASARLERAEGEHMLIAEFLSHLGNTDDERAFANAVAEHELKGFYEMAEREGFEVAGQHAITFAIGDMLVTARVAIRRLMAERMAATLGNGETVTIADTDVAIDMMERGAEGAKNVADLMGNILTEDEAAVVYGLTKSTMDAIMEEVPWIGMAGNVVKNQIAHAVICAVLAGRVAIGRSLD